MRECKDCIWCALCGCNEACDHWYNADVEKATDEAEYTKMLEEQRLTDYEVELETEWSCE